MSLYRIAQKYIFQLANFSREVVQTRKRTRRAARGRYFNGVVGGGEWMPTEHGH
jgi:hypothetical protein